MKKLGKILKKEELKMCLLYICSVSMRATVHARTRQWAVRTHGCDIYDVTSATTQSSSVRVCTSAVQREWSGTNTPPDEGGQNYLHVPTQCTQVWLV